MNAFLKHFVNISLYALLLTNTAFSQTIVELSGSHWKYREHVNGQPFMNDTSMFWGFHSEYINTPRAKHWIGFTLDGRYGKVHYHGGTSGGLTFSSSNNVDLVVDTKLTTGMTTTKKWKPYIGAGYRRLWDISDTVTEYAETGGLSYTRISNYFYIPIGFYSPIKTINPSLDYQWNLEIDPLIAGLQYSDIGNMNRYHGQHHGIGLRGECRFFKKKGNTNYTITPFFNYWHINDSSIIFSDGDDTSVRRTMEPNNSTIEFGLRIGMEW